jgi:hypothetical protein
MVVVMDTMITIVIVEVLFLVEVLGCLCICRECRECMECRDFRDLDLASDTVSVSVPVPVPALLGPRSPLGLAALMTCSLSLRPVKAAVVVITAVAHIDIEMAGVVHLVTIVTSKSTSGQLPKRSSTAIRDPSTSRPSSEKPRFTSSYGGSRLVLVNRFVATYRYSQLTLSDTMAAARKTQRKEKKKDDKMMNKRKVRCLRYISSC